MEYYPKHKGVIQDGSLVLDDMMFLSVERIRANDEWVQDIIDEMYIGVSPN